MNTDFRVSVDFFAHHKTKKLQKRIGDGGIISLLHLWAYVAKIKPDGDISSLSAEDIEIAADWEGEDGKFVSSAVEAGFLEEHEGEYSLHHWVENNPWAAEAVERGDKARLSVMASKYPCIHKQLTGAGYKGISKEEYRRLTSFKEPLSDISFMAERPLNDRSTSDEEMLTNRQRDDNDSSTPSPSPSPTTTTKPCETDRTRTDENQKTEPEVPENSPSEGTSMSEILDPPAEMSSDSGGARPDQGGKGIETSPDFERFWAVYPRATGKGKAYERWQKTLEDGAKPDDLIHAAAEYAAERRAKNTAPGYVKHPATFLGPARHWRGYLREMDVGDVSCPRNFAYEELAELWDTHMPPVGFMHAPEPTRKWKMLLSERVAENPARRDNLDWWLERFREIDDSDFASGRTPGKGGLIWRLELHRLLESEEALQKLINGVYRNREVQGEQPQYVAVVGSDAECWEN